MATQRKAASVVSTTRADKDASVTVRALTPIRHGADDVAEGETFACDPDEADILIAQGAAKAVRAN